MRYMGIDYGARDVGVALTDEMGHMAFPHAVLSNSKRLTSDLLELIHAKGVGVVVIGSSLNHHGEKNPIMERIEHLVTELKAQGVTIEFEPEQYTSKEAARGQETSSKLDASAAAIILNSYLTKQNPQSVLDE